MEHVNGWPFSVSFVTRGSKVSHRIDMGSHQIKQAFRHRVFSKKVFFFLNQNMLWLLKRTVSMRRFLIC